MTARSRMHVRLRHARHYVETATIAYALYAAGGDQQREGMALFDQEQRQIDLAWEWLLHAADPSKQFHHEAMVHRELDNLILELTEVTKEIGDVRYRLHDKRIPQFEGQLAAAYRQGRKDAVWAALGSLGIAFSDLGDMQISIAYHEQQLEVARELDDLARIAEANALGSLGVVYSLLGDFQRAITYHEQDLAIARAFGDRRGEAHALGNLGSAYMELGDQAYAMELHQQQLTIARALGDRSMEATALGNVGIVLKNLGNFQQAIMMQQQRLAIARELGDRRGEATALGNLGVAAQEAGKLQQAIGYYQQCIQLFSELGNRAGVARNSWNLGLIYERLGDLREAVDLLQVCVDYEEHQEHADATQDAAYLEGVRKRLDPLIRSAHF